jgi:hypothetical protein
VPLTAINRNICRLCGKSMMNIQGMMANRKSSSTFKANYSSNRIMISAQGRTCEVLALNQLLFREVYWTMIVGIMNTWHNCRRNAMITWRENLRKRKAMWLAESYYYFSWRRAIINKLRAAQAINRNNKSYQLLSSAQEPQMP